jgi:hypothetical protein
MISMFLGERRRHKNEQTEADISKDMFSSIKNTPFNKLTKSKFK